MTDLETLNKLIDKLDTSDPDEHHHQWDLIAMKFLELLSVTPMGATSVRAGFREVARRLFDYRENADVEWWYA